MVVFWKGSVTTVACLRALPVPLFDIVKRLTGRRFRFPMGRIGLKPDDAMFVAKVSLVR
jgi:hypothetical protein